MDTVDFSQMGFDIYATDFLNWCLKHRDNLEFLKEKDIMELKAASAELHFTDLGVLTEIESRIRDKRT